MKKLLIGLALFALPATAHAENWDVIGSKFKDGCSYGKYMSIVQDFNKWGAGYGYTATILMPVHSDTPDVFFWIGRTKDTATYGAAWDAWFAALRDPNSDASKLSARFDACATNVSRSSYSTM